MKKILEIGSHHLFASQSVKSSQSCLQCLRIGADVRVVLIKVAFKWEVGGVDLVWQNSVLESPENDRADLQDVSHPII